METEFIFWRHATSPGIRVEEICGGEDKSGTLWKTLALQVFGENGGDRFREIVHTDSGAPLLEDSSQRISISHTPHFWVAAFLPRTPESDLQEFSLRTAMGIDAEKADREQAYRVADRVMTPEEMTLIKEYAENLEKGNENHSPLERESALIKAAVLGWTIKEALYKAALEEGMDFKEKLRIDALPEICSFPTVKNPRYGKGMILRKSGEKIEMELFSYESEGQIVTLAYSPKCAKFSKNS
ncbi:MAG: 4'-phosphopantetheinyl transferase superfamily protein [Muribaculaceae bacterium]|nr:4'-phosphopantetheinyl transferase superfamily protein [Muribaculaceae bacterium]